jgi:hypothetical protein
MKKILYPSHQTIPILSYGMRRSRRTQNFRMMSLTQSCHMMSLT